MYGWLRIARRYTSTRTPADTHSPIEIKIIKTNERQSEPASDERTRWPTYGNGGGNSSHQHNRSHTTTNMRPTRNKERKIIGNFRLNNGRTADGPCIGAALLHGVCMCEFECVYVCLCVCVDETGEPCREPINLNLLWNARCFLFSFWLKQKGRVLCPLHRQSYTMEDHTHVHDVTKKPMHTQRRTHAHRVIETRWCRKYTKTTTNFCCVTASLII